MVLCSSCDCVPLKFKKKDYFNTLYFDLPIGIPPRPLGGAGVCKHRHTKIYMLIG
jgi:hypothetical protein